MQLEVINPFNGDLVETLETSDEAAINEAYAAARAAQPSWQKLGLDARIKIMGRFKELLSQQQHSLAEILCSEMGKPVHQAEAEIAATCRRIQWFMDNVESATRTQVSFQDEVWQESISWEPRGVVACVSAWNFPYFVGSNVYVPALLTGNAVLYKPSEWASLTGLKVQQLLVEAGVPAEVFAVLVGGGRVGAAVVQQQVDGVFFTGSVETGGQIARAVAGRMIPCQLELGGKDGCYVTDEVDVAVAAAAVGDGAFYNAGQSCCAVERIYVHQAVYQDFLKYLGEFAASLPVGDPRDPQCYMGPLTLPNHGDFLEKQVNEALNDGGKLLVAGGPALRQNYRPTVVADAPQQSSLMRRESFGPVVGVAPVENDEHALEMMADSAYGLTGSVYCQNPKRLHGLLEQLPTGTVYGNACDRVSPHVPWSGRGLSGLGVTLSYLGIQAMVQPKAWQVRQR